MSTTMPDDRATSVPPEPAPGPGLVRQLDVSPPVCQQGGSLFRTCTHSGLTARTRRQVGNVLKRDWTIWSRITYIAEITRRNSIGQPGSVHWNSCERNLATMRNHDDLPKTLSKRSIECKVLRERGYRSRFTTLTLRYASWIIAALCVVFLALSQPAAAFNLDVEKMVIHRSDDIGSMFGFTVAQYTDRNGPWLIVGAPEANTAQPNVVRPGAVYRCPTRNGTSCVQLPFDSEGNEFLTAQISNKSMQWFGASLSTSPDQGYIAACAPRYVYFTTNYAKREPIGSCLLMEDGRATKRFQPCKSDRPGRSEGNAQTFCEAGFSMALDQDKVAIGAVGSFYWQGQLIVQEVEDPLSNILETWESSTIHDNDNRGYALVVGDFDSDGNQDVAVSAPRADGGNGAIQIFSVGGSLMNFANLSGEGQLGEFFGLSLTAGDFNGDGNDDVVVGAPFYTDRTSRSYDTGRIYVFLQSPNSLDRFPEYQIITGPKQSRARFGFAVSTAGDLNDDGFNGTLQNI